MKRSFLLRLRAARFSVMEEIRANSTGSRFASALAGEGYAGGYLAALDDVEAILTHGYPCDARHYWDKELQQERAALRQKQEGE